MAKTEQAAFYSVPIPYMLYNNQKGYQLSNIIIIITITITITITIIIIIIMPADAVN